MIDNILDRINGDFRENTLILKPCPFCSSKHAHIAGYGEQFAIECPDCDCSTRLCDTQEEVADAWNMRDGKEEKTEDYE